MILHGLLALGATLGQLDEAAVREQVKQVWQSTDTLRFTSLETIESTDATVLDRYEYAFRHGGRSRLRMYRGLGDEQELVLDERQDGRRSYRIGPFPGYPGSINTVTIANQESTADHYGGTMSRAMWALMPGGRTPAAHLDAGATLTRSNDAWNLETEHRGLALRCELDPEHDWLPRWVELGDRLRVEVTDYAYQDGRWLSRSGVAKELPAGKENRLQPGTTSFEITEFAINPLLDDAEFGVPRVPDGVAIIDQTTGKTQFQGGRAARDRLVEKYPYPKAEENLRQEKEAQKAMDFLVVKDQPRWPSLLPPIGVCVSLSLLIFAAYRFMTSLKR